jgi:RecA/RadA recombinase
MAAKKRAAEEEERPKPKKGEAAPSRDSRIDALIADVMKKSRGRALIQPASEYNLPFLYKRLPTGLLTLDRELKGGWPAGGISQLIGRKNAGKTALMWMTVRQLQYFLGNKMKVLLAMTELQADRSQARLLGVKISMGDADIKMMNDARIENGWPPFTKEEIAMLKEEVGRIDELHALAVEDFYDIILRAVEENMYHLIVIDSIGNALSAAEQENDSVHDKVYGGISGPNTTFLKKLTNLLTMKTEYGEIRDTCVLGINQVRDNIKDPNKQYKAPGGNSLEHAKLVDIYVESGKFLGEDVPVMTPEGTKKLWRAYGKEVHWKVEKGKAGMHEGARGSYVYDFRMNNVDYYTDTLIAGVMDGVILAEGAWIGIPDPNNEGKYLMRIQGRENFIAALAKDAQDKAATEQLSYMDYIRDQCFKRNNINISYDWE